MKRINLEVCPKETSGEGQVLLELFRNIPATQFHQTILDHAFKAFKPKALDFIWNIEVSESLDEEPHEIYVDYRTSFTDADFEVDDKLTDLGRFLKNAEGFLHGDPNEITVDLALDTVLSKHFWNPEWPRPTAVKLGWEVKGPPFDMTVICAIDSDEQLAHLLFHNHLDDILNGMLPIMEEFLNLRVQEILGPNAVRA